MGETQDIRRLDKSTPGSKVFKACESCRQRKVRCDGLLPCQPCVQRSIPCSFRQSARRRLSNQIQKVQIAPSDGDRMPVLSDDCAAQSAPPVLPRGLRHQNHLNYILDALQVVDGPSGRGRVTRSFGSTSTVTVLNVILDLIARLDGSPPNSLATASPSKPHTYVLEYLRQVIVRCEAHPPPIFSPSPPGPLDTVPLQLQSLLLERYIAMGWKTLPFQSPHSLQARLPSLSAQPISQLQAEDQALRAIMLPMIAIGSITTGYAELGEMLIGEAQRNPITPYYLGDILALQSDLLMIQYHIDSGSFEAAYLRLGMALAKILAAGMDKPTRSPHEQAIISAFCCNERLPSPSRT
ncbi:uncharacterized protein BP01DRAFT_122014 [Aspergillus saccharolyticus JOP 1030-1]|uniref:Zn(2)-C6 fungal-type domain-containing protein n=1 Tax=Aspergillus saccharolyticus JOP 1030-1 TaxID=1450539 RepID=A0A318ZE51_9EURO|nr:hypothetical protein BP01DRAFT_122014 [Aspergillus saccharolyticus JOP 1030-1]PYH42963.1 hypothetical protein BP01DRAFT_122014 [Aspergillus saccharolyticus JOP 1030-1]